MKSILLSRVDSQRLAMLNSVDREKALEVIAQHIRRRAKTLGRGGLGSPTSKQGMNIPVNWYR